MLEVQHEWRIQIFCFAFAEMIFGLAVSLFADVPGILALTAIVSSAAAIIALLFCLTQPHAIKTYDLLATMLMVAYGFGTLNSLVAFAVNHGDLLRNSSVSESWLTRTLGYCIASSGLLHAIGRIHANSFIFSVKINSDIRIHRNAWLCGIVMLVGLFMISTGRIGYMGGIADANGGSQISVSAALILALMAPAGAMAVFQARRSDNRKISWMFLCMAVLILLPQFGLGRRIFFFTLLLYFFAAILAKRPRKFINFRSVIVVLLAAGLIQIGTTAFYALRVASYSVKNEGSSLSVTTLLPEALKVYENRERNFLSDRISDNVKSRTFILEYLATLVYHQDSMPPMYGENLARAIIMVIPSSIYPNKFKNPLFGSEENLSHPHFHMPVWDAANSVYTAGVVDFGVCGIFILPLAVCFVFSALLSLVRKYLPCADSLFISFLVVYSLLAIEVDLPGYYINCFPASLFGFFIWLFWISSKSTGQVNFSDWCWWNEYCFVCPSRIHVLAKHATLCRYAERCLYCQGA